MINGNSNIIEIGKESTYGTVATPTYRIQVSTEDLKWSPTKKEEGLLTGLRTKGKSETMGIKTEGKLSTLVRPDFAGFFLKGLLGLEATPAVATGSTVAYTHTFTAIGNGESDYLPSYTVIADRKAKIFTYNGLVIGSIDFSAQPEDYLKFDVSLNGKDEGTGSTDTTLSISPLKAFKFKEASVKFNGSKLADVTSIKLFYNNGLDTSVQTTDTGVYYKQPQAGTREIKIDGEMLYTSAAESLRDTWYKTDGTTSMEIKFESDQYADETNKIPYSLTFTIPYGQIEMPNTTTSDGTLKQSFTYNALENGSDQLITATLVNTMATAY